MGLHQELEEWELPWALAAEEDADPLAADRRLLVGALVELDCCELVALELMLVLVREPVQTQALELEMGQMIDFQQRSSRSCLWT